MYSAEQKTGQNQEEQNRNVLHRSELGAVLNRAYDDAVAVDPRLADIAITPIAPGGDGTHIFARPSWAPQNQTGRHEVCLRVDSFSQTAEFFEKTYLSVAKNREILAANLRISSEELTPSLVFVQAVLHEMGHVIEYLGYEELGKSPDYHRRDVLQELDKLPVTRTKVSQLLTEENPTRQRVVENWTRASGMAAIRYAQYRRQPVTINTMEDLANATADVYRHSRFEAAADRFANDILTNDPQLLKQAMRP